MSFCQSCGVPTNDQSTLCPACGAQRAAQGYTPVAATPGGAAAPAAAGASGLSANAAGALTYLLGLLTGVIFLVIDPYKSYPFVRFHAFQSIFFNLAWIAFWIAWSIVSFILTAFTKGIFGLISLPVDLLIGLGGLCLWLYLMYSAYKGNTLRLPFIGNLAAKQAGL